MGMPAKNDCISDGAPFKNAIEDMLASAYNTPVPNSNPNCNADNDDTNEVISSKLMPPSHKLPATMRFPLLTSDKSLPSGLGGEGTDASAVTTLFVYFSAARSAFNFFKFSCLFSSLMFAYVSINWLPSASKMGLISDESRIGSVN